MKVTQYEVLGWGSEKVIRPGQDGRSAGYTCEARYGRQRAESSIVPVGTDTSLECQPSTSCWATFIRSLRDDSSPRPSIVIRVATKIGTRRYDPNPRLKPHPPGPKHIRIRPGEAVDNG